jgi:long-chain acyl-CoA synthetase
MPVHTPLFSERLDELAATTPSLPAVIDTAGTVSYAELRQRVCSLTDGLKRRGVRPIDRVGLLLPNSAELVAALLACFRLGAVAVPLPPRLPAEEWDRVFHDSEPCLALIEASLTGAFAVPPAMTVPDLLAGGLPRADEGLTGDEEEPGDAPGADDVAVLLYTSGTTARPKGVMHLQGRLARAAARRAVWQGFTPGDRVAALMTLTHAFGLAGALLPAVSVGATLLLPPLEEPVPLARFLAEKKATLALAPPRVYASLARLAGPIPHPGSLRCCYSGGDVLTEEVARAFAGWCGVEIRQGCGMTELPGYCILPGHAPNRPGSIGFPVPGVDLRLIAYDAEPGERDLPDTLPAVPVGEVGEIWVRSDVGSVGYWNNPAATATLLRDGWIRTGDLARADADGYLYFAGRRG